MSKIKQAIFTFLLIFSFASLVEAANDRYVPGISDLPVPANFYLKKDSSSVFENQEGRIVDATFLGRSSKPEIEEFYNLTLQALGWERRGVFTYVRESEELHISVDEIEDKQLNNLVIHFSLRPQGKK